MAPWSIEVFTDSNGYSPFTNWLEKDLRPVEVEALDIAIQKILAPNGNSLASTKWLTPLGRGLYEFRISHTADEIEGFYSQKEIGKGKKHQKILLRVFVHFYGKKVVLILGGYNKGARDQTRYQQEQISQARKLLKKWKSYKD